MGVSHGRGTITSGKFRDEGYQKSLNYLNKFGLFWEILTKFQELYWERCVLTENRYFPRVEKVIGQPIAQLFAQADEKDKDEADGFMPECCNVRPGSWGMRQQRG